MEGNDRKSSNIQRHYFELETFDPEELNVIFGKNQKKALAFVSKVFTPNLQPSNTRAKQILQTIHQVLPIRELLFLYIRWSKKTRRNHHTDTVAVMKTLAKEYPNIFKTQYVAIRKARILRYQPTLDKRRVCHPVFQNNLSYIRNDELYSKASSNDSYERQIEKKIKTFEDIVKNTSLNAKIGMRCKKGEGPSDQSYSPREITVSGKKLQHDLANMLECHLPASFTNRVSSSAADRCTSYKLLWTLFVEKRQKWAELGYYSILFTKDCKESADFYKRFSGFCLKFETVESIKQADQNRYYSVEGIESLASECDARAEAQFHREPNEHNIAMAILKVNRLCSRQECTWEGSRKKPEQQYSILRAYSLQTWVSRFGGQELTPLYLEVQRGLGFNPTATDTVSRKRGRITNNDTTVQPASKQAKVEMETAFFVQDSLNQELYKRMTESLGHSVFDPDKSR